MSEKNCCLLGIAGRIHPRSEVVELTNELRVIFYYQDGNTRSELRAMWRGFPSS